MRNGGLDMANNDVERLLECIQNHAFCEDVNGDYDYCCQTDCTDCQIEFCKKELEQGHTLMF